MIVRGVLYLYSRITISPWDAWISDYPLGKHHCYYKTDK